MLWNYNNIGEPKFKTSDVVYLKLSENSEQKLRQALKEFSIRNDVINKLISEKFIIVTMHTQKHPETDQLVYMYKVALNNSDLASLSALFYQFNFAENCLVKDNNINVSYTNINLWKKCLKGG